VPHYMLHRLIAPIALVLVLGLVPAIPAAGATAKHRSGHPSPHHRRHPAPKPAAPPAAPAAAVPVTCADTSLIPTAGNVSRVAAATLCLVNQQRAAAGRTPLRANAALDASASQYSLDMVAGNFLSHVSPSGAGPLDRVEASGYLSSANGYWIAENIAASIGADAAPDATVALWMSSPAVRANIISPDYTDTGIGVAPAVPALIGADLGATYTEVFAAAGQIRA
jgi:uncharacterized protein YkwD